MPTVQDPRTIITPSSFAIAPELLGQPLARPWRRAVAILLDLMLIGILVVLLEAPSVFFGAAVAVLLFRITAARPDASPWARALRGVVRFFTAILVFAVSVSIWSSVAGRLKTSRPGDPDPAAATAPAGIRVLEGSFVGLGIATADVIRLATATNEADARAASERIVSRIPTDELGPEEIHEIRQALAETGGVGLSRIAAAELDRALRALAPPPATTAPAVRSETADDLTFDLAAAIGAKDSVRAESLRIELAGLLARDTVAAIQRRTERLDRRISRLERENRLLKDERDRAAGGVGLVRWIRATLDDLGIGFGWMALYFTAFPALWRGRTPGKRLLGIRVIRLDGKPIGWWAAFERFGGYAAGLLTGLLGFLQILWDRNRQAIHDKISETVVVLDRAIGEPGPAA